MDGLDQAALQEAFRLLTSDYIGSANLDALEVNRSALQGMLERLDFGATLLTTEKQKESNSPFPFYFARVDDAVGYVRFGHFGEDEVEAFDAALKEIQEKKTTTHLIVDLRSPQAQASFETAANLLSRFLPPNEMLFKIRRPGSERSTLFVSSPVTEGCRLKPILLVDQDTGNVGEVMAAVLKLTQDCFIVGEQTPGLSVEYRDVPLGEDRILRFATAEVLLEDNSSIFPEGITPDLIAATPQKTKFAFFQKLDKGTPLKSLIFHKARPHMNEAALVAGTDPEIDYNLLLSQGKPTPWDQPPIQDNALQQTVDLLGATRFLQSDPKKAR